MNIYIFVIGIIIGYLIAYFFSGRKVGEQGRLKSIKFEIKGYIVHFHHWLIFSVILILLILLRIYNNFVYGLLVGVIAQGLSYRDFYKTVYKK
jgi:hypothetical protein